MPDRWRDRLKALADEHGNYRLLSLRLKGVSQHIIEALINNRRQPTLDEIRRIAEGVDYPTAEQLYDLGILQNSLVPWATMERERPSPLVLINRLWHAIDVSSSIEPGIPDLVRELLRSCVDDEPRNPGRWSCRVFDIPSGKRYRRVAFHGVEFRLAEGQKAWTEAEWEKQPQNEQVSSTLAAPWIDERLRPDSLDENFRTRLAPAGDTSHATRELAWERRELAWRLRKILPLVTGSWVGETGVLQRTISGGQDSPHRQIFLTRPFQDLLPDPATQIAIKWLEQERRDNTPEQTADGYRVLLIGPPSLTVEVIAALVAGAFGIRSVTTRELLGRITGQTHRYNAAHRPAKYAQVHRYLLSPEMPRNMMVAVLELDAVMTTEQGEGVLTPDFRALLEDEKTYPIVLLPTEHTADSWEQRQLDRMFPNDEVADSHRKEVAAESLSLICRFLSQTRYQRGGWAGFRVQSDFPWWPPNPTKFVEPVIGDLLVRVAFQLAKWLYHGETTTRQRIPFAHGTLLSRHQDDLHKDNLLQGQLAAIRNEPGIVNGPWQPIRPLGTVGPGPHHDSVHIVFEQRRATLPPSAHQQLEKVASLLKTYSQANIVITGFDTVSLSTARMEAILAHLREHRFDENRWKFRYAVPNATDHRDTRNRRTVVVAVHTQ